MYAKIIRSQKIFYGKNEAYPWVICEQKDDFSPGKQIIVCFFIYRNATFWKAKKKKFKWMTSTANSKQMKTSEEYHEIKNHSSTEYHSPLPFFFVNYFFSYLCVRRKILVHYSHYFWNKKEKYFKKRFTKC